MPASEAPPPEVDPSGLGALAPKRSDHEHRRVVGSARRRLFGGDRIERVGRYRVERRLGPRPFGPGPSDAAAEIVAHDDALSRRVIVLHALAGLDAAALEGLRGRLEALAELGEARALDQLRLLDMGTHAGRPYVVLEERAGVSLQQWSQQAKRRWPELVEVFERVGQTLAALHRAGLVHGAVDQGVFVERDGASYLSAPLPLPGSEHDAAQDRRALAQLLIDASWPESPAEAPPRSLSADLPPRALWSALRRDWPTTEALLRAVSRASRVRRRATLAGLGAATLGLGLSAALATSLDTGAARDGQLGAAERERSSLCARYDADLGGTWDADTRARLARPWAAPAPADATPHVRESGVRGLAGLDAWAKAWTDARAQLCEDSSSAPSSEALAAGLACLEHRRRTLSSLLTAMTELERGGAPLRPHQLATAVVAVVDLPPPTRCLDPSVAPIQSEPIEHALALLSLGEGERAHALARSLLEDGDEDSRPQARAVLALARAQANGPHASADARAVALDALMQAWRGLPSPEAASLRATVELELALRLRAAGPSSMWAGTQAFADDVGRQALDPRASPRARAARAFLRAQLQLGEGEAASRALHAAVEASEGSPGTARWIYLEALARDRFDAGELERARSLRERALTEAEAALGPEHPALAPLVFALATTREGSDPANEPANDPTHKEQLERAAALWRQGPPSTRDTGALSTIEETLARAALAEGELERARDHALALAQLQAQRFAPDAPEQLPNLFLLATVALREGQAEAARPLLDAAATILAALPAEDPRRVSASRELALATAELDALAESAD